MPRNAFQRFIFSLLTVFITVQCYVFYSLYVVNGQTFLTLAASATSAAYTSVLDAIGVLGGVYMCGHYVPIWAVIAVEFCFAILLEMLVGSPFSFKLASMNFDPRTTHPVLFETAIICATVGIMCPAMSFIAAFLYYPYYEGFRAIRLLANWLRLVCYNFPFAFFTQLFFIQPLIRKVFKLLFRRDLAARKAAEA